MDSLLSALADFDRRLKEHDEMEVTNEEADAIVLKIVDTVGVGTNEPAKVTFSPVHTYIHQLDKDPTASSSSAIVVPPFACHWGIVVGPPTRQRLFHLVFVADLGNEAKNSTVENRHIQFYDSRFPRSLANAKYVGQTCYNTDQLIALGEAMIQEFGNYHKVFWNCQTFAKCYLRVITGDYKANFDSWTAADTSRLFLCAFLVGAPFATTNKVKEDLEAERLVRKIKSIPEHLSTEDKSAEAISAIYASLKQNTLWGIELGKLEDTTARPGFLDGLFKLLFRRS
jgi:hypothetical protein